MMAILVYPLWIFFARTLDRFGKGLRTAARDAMLSQQSTKETKASVFGFHRAMDTVGAAIGPIIALVFLYFFQKIIHRYFISHSFRYHCSVADLFN
jgi:MFS family permease